MSITSDRTSRPLIWPVLMVCGIGGVAGAAPLDDVRSLATQKTWIEQGPDESGVVRSRKVTAEIWTTAFQRHIDEKKRLEIPARAEPYYVDGPLVLPSGATIVADPKAEIRLTPGVNTCIVRNANLVGFADGPVSADLQPDTEITIEGGIWTTTLATTPEAPQGNVRGRSASAKPVAGTHGVILLHNVRGVRIRDITIRESRPFAIHLGNVKDFVVDGLRLDHTHRDGVHVSGPASDGLIRNVRGVSKDDPVALTAWDWRQYAPSYGPIERIVIEDVTGSPPLPTTRSACCPERNTLPTVACFPAQSATSPCDGSPISPSSSATTSRTSKFPPAPIAATRSAGWKTFASSSSRSIGPVQSSCMPTPTAS
jgi:hypothetical protein